MGITPDSYYDYALVTRYWQELKQKFDTWGMLTFTVVVLGNSTTVVKLAGAPGTGRAPIGPKITEE